MQNESESSWPFPFERAGRKEPTNFNRMTADLLRRAGWEAEVTQATNASINTSKDLFGFGDVMGFIPYCDTPSCLIVQACGTGDRTHRLRKVLSIDLARKFVTTKNRLLWVMHWTRHKKTPGKWVVRVDNLIEEDFQRYQNTGEVPDICHSKLCQDVEGFDVHTEQRIATGCVLNTQSRTQLDTSQRTKRTQSQAVGAAQLTSSTNQRRGKQ